MSALLGSTANATPAGKGAALSGPAATVCSSSDGGVAWPCAAPHVPEGAGHYKLHATTPLRNPRDDLVDGLQGGQRLRKIDVPQKISPSTVANSLESSLDVARMPVKGGLATSKDVTSSTALETEEQPHESEEALRINSVKMKSKGQRCLHIEEPKFFEDAVMKECWRRAMDEELRSI